MKSIVGCVFISFLTLLYASPVIGCSQEMVVVGPWCVDKYEASINTNSDCRSGKWLNSDKDELSVVKDGIAKNGEIRGSGAYACSKSDVRPARWVTWFQASSLCALSGKQIIPDSIWVTAAIGTDKSKCSINKSDSQLANLNCKSQWGVFDMVGNLWEWTDAWVVTGRTSIERNNAPYSPSSSKDGIWPSNYCDLDKGKCFDTIWGVNGEAGSGHELVEGLPAAILRGGNFKMLEAAGVYTMSLNAAPSHFRETSGFRCAKPRR